MAINKDGLLIIRIEKKKSLDTVIIAQKTGKSLKLKRLRTNLTQHFKIN